MLRKQLTLNIGYMKSNIVLQQVSTTSMIKATTLITLILMSSIASSQTPKKSESVSINGKYIHYEIYGEGNPLFLLHGYTQSSQSWKPYVTD